MAGYIRYQEKNGALYASFIVGKRVGGKKENETTNLGRVIDKERMVYKNRKQGIFTFTPESGVRHLPGVPETGIYDFGNAYVYSKVIESSGLSAILRDVFGADYDTLSAMMFYRTLQGGANSGAVDWYEGSWAKSLFPNAGLQSQRLSEFFERIGNERVTQRFFKAYLPFAKCSNAILIDSTGLPNAIDMPLTAVSNHGGQVSEETRYILVHDKETNIPIYYRYVAGNIVDVSTMATTLRELETYGTHIDYALLDAGYCSENNISQLYSDNIRFVTRLGRNRKLYNTLCDNYLPTLQGVENLVRYRERLVYIRRAETSLYGNDGYAYVALDFDRRNSQFKKYMLEELSAGEKTHEELAKECINMGVFILISSERLDIKDILPLYYKRQAIEQMFDISKNCADILPLRTHNEATFRGHLLLSFITTAGYSLADKLLENTRYSLSAALAVLRNLKIKVYPTTTVVQEPTKKIKDISAMLKVPIPATV